MSSVPLDKHEIAAGFGAVKEARAEWAEAHTTFQNRVELVMARLILEAVCHRMSVEQIASMSGLTPKRVRLIMRSRGLDTKRGLSVLSKSAADALQENADLLGVDATEIDLTSPLAYLPLGKNLRKFLETGEDR